MSLTKINHLVNSGFKIESSDSIAVVFTDEFGYEFCIRFDDFEDGESRDIIMDHSDMYSPFCGEYVDKDYRRCPSCQESI